MNLLRRAMPHFIGTLVLLCLSACSPHFDWRDHQGSGILATFPDKVQSAERNIDLDGLSVNMQMDAARVDDISFVIGTVTLPDDSSATATRALNAMRTALLRNIGVEVRSAGGAAGGVTTTTTIARVFAQAEPVPAIALQTLGNANGVPVLLAARFAVHDKHAYQIAVLGPVSQLSSPAEKEAIDTFLSSARIN